MCQGEKKAVQMEGTAYAAPRGTEIRKQESVLKFIYQKLRSIWYGGIAIRELFGSRGRVLPNLTQNPTGIYGTYTHLKT